MMGASASGTVRLSEAERFDWLRLSRSENIGPRTFKSLLDRYGSAGAALEALPDLARGKGRTVRIANIEEIERECELMQGAGASFIALCEPDYPQLLRLIDSPPPLIAARGDLAVLGRSKLAIVGSRNASAAGLAFTEQLARGLAQAGYVIVSGLARGIDARAHQASVQTGTIAVLAGGLGRIYPAEHAPLLERIAERGVAISEMPFTWEARGRDFPRRNRIVSGLSQGIIVVEAARRSGSLITARFATEQGRQVFAVPGSPLDPRAEGPNDLLQEGASFCTKAQDVIDALAGQALSRFYPDLSEASSLDEPYVALWDELDPADGPAPASAPARLEPDEMPRPAPAAEESGPVRLLKRTPEEISQLILDLLGPAPVSVDELARVAETSAREVRTVLIGLEMEGRLERHGGNLVSLLLPVRNASGRDRAE